MASALTGLGYRCLHDSEYGEKMVLRALNEGRPLLHYLSDDYDAFADYPFDVNFATLDRQYPGSSFVLTERDYESWLGSRLRHFVRYGYGGTVPFSEESDRKLYRSHAEGVKLYFGKTARLLRFNMFEGDGWEKLCSFLGSDIPDKPFPHENRTPDEYRRAIYVGGENRVACAATSGAPATSQHSDDGE